MSGAVAGIAEHCVMYPLDTIRTRAQALAHPGQQVHVPLTTQLIFISCIALLSVMPFIELSCMAVGGVYIEDSQQWSAEQGESVKININLVWFLLDLLMHFIS